MREACISPNIAVVNPERAAQRAGEFYELCRTNRSPPDRFADLRDVPTAKAVNKDTSQSRRMLAVEK